MSDPRSQRLDAPPAMANGTHAHAATQWPDEAATEAWARGLAGHVRRALDGANDKPLVIELEGQLGAGKTTFVRHLLRALGVQGRVKSPSYAIVEPYELPGLNVWHFDFYRFGDPREWEDAGFRELFASPGLHLVEWPEKARTMLPTPDLQIHLHLRPDDDARDVQVHAATPTGLALLARLNTP